jgi:hypothetical protein
MGQAVGGLVQQGAEHIGGAALQAFAADQDLGPVGGLVGELPAGGGEVTEIEPPAAGSLPKATTITTWGTSGWWLRMAVQACSRAATRWLAAARSTGGAAVMT